MTSTRKTATIVGLLFLTQTVAFIIAEQLITGVLKRPNYLTGFSADANALTLGGLFAVVAGVLVVGIAVLLFPLLKPTSEPLVVPLLMIAISNGLRDGTLNASSSQSLGPILKATHDLAIVVLYLVTSVGGTILAVLLYRSRLVPRWIAVLALIGYPVLLVGCVLDLFGVTDVTKGAGLVAVAPGGIFELILPIWLLVKGFSSSVQVLPGQDVPQVVRTL